MLSRFFVNRPVGKLRLVDVNNAGSIVGKTHVVDMGNLLQFHFVTLLFVSHLRQGQDTRPVPSDNEL